MATVPAEVAKVALATAPTIFEAVIELNVEPLPINLLAVTLPAALKMFDAASNVNPELAPALPLSLNNTCVLDPGTTILPEMLPWKLPRKYPAVAMLPVAEITPAVPKFPTVAFPATVNVDSVPTDVILG